MSKEKQIEKMAKVIKSSLDGLGSGNFHFTGDEISTMFAKFLYNAGYRKQSENTVELPFKVGDTVYVPWRWAFQQAVAIVKVEEIKFYDSQMHYMFLVDMESDNECFNQSFGGWKTDASIGKTVFLTREEAEKTLAKMKGGAE